MTQLYSQMLVLNYFYNKYDKSHIYMYIVVYQIKDYAIDIIDTSKYNMNINKAYEFHARE